MEWITCQFEQYYIHNYQFHCVWNIFENSAKIYLNLKIRWYQPIYLFELDFWDFTLEFLKDWIFILFDKGHKKRSLTTCDQVFMSWTIFPTPIILNMLAKTKPLNPNKEVKRFICRIQYYLAFKPTTQLTFRGPYLWN